MTRKVVRLYAELVAELIWGRSRARTRSQPARGARASLRGCVQRHVRMPPGTLSGGARLFETMGLGGVRVIIVNPVQQAGTAGKQGSQFSGEVFPYLTLPSTDGVVINTVNFTPGARTFWHSHERGQIILVVAGRGLIQARGGSVHVLRAGDTVWAPPGESHWHGAAPDSYLVHTAISLGTTNWAEAVTDAEYAAPDRDDS